MILLEGHFFTVEKGIYYYEVDEDVYDSAVAHIQ